MVNMIVMGIEYAAMIGTGLFCLNAGNLTGVIVGIVNLLFTVASIIGNYYLMKNDQEAEEFYDKCLDEDATFMDLEL